MHAGFQPDASGFASGRQFAAWLGLVPRQNSSGGKDRLGSITKAGDQYLRKLLVIGATVVIFHAGKKGAPGWLTSLLARKPKKVAAVGLLYIAQEDLSAQGGRLVLASPRANVARLLDLTEAQQTFTIVP